jgi:flagellar motor switch protein FliM
MSDILSDKELDALMESVGPDGSGQDGDLSASEDYQRYDLTSGVNRIKQLAERINQIDERIQITLANAMLGILQKNIVVMRGILRIEKFENYCETLSIPSSINAFSLSGLPGKMGLVLENALVNETVNLYFGGVNKSNPMPKKEFTLIETRIISILIKAIIDSVQQAWKAFAEYELKQEESETNPASAKLFRPVEVVLVRPFKLEINGSVSEFHILMPGSMIEAILSGKKDSIPEATRALIARKRTLAYELDVAGLFRHAELSIDEIFSLEVGSVIPVGSPDDLEVRLNDAPKLKARLGEINNKYALLVR